MTMILVVEAHPVFAQSLTRFLHERGHYDVTIAETGDEAIERLNERVFDLALIDISLPGKSGIWLLEAFHHQQPELPCMILSGHASGVYLEQSIRAGARGYVLKDDVSGILEGIEAVLHGGTFISEALRLK